MRTQAPECVDVTRLTPASKWHDQFPHVYLTPEPMRFLPQLQGRTVSLGLCEGALPFAKPGGVSDDQPRGFPILSHRDLFSLIAQEDNGRPSLVVFPHFRGGRQPTTPIVLVLGQMTVYSPGSCCQLSRSLQS